MQNFSITEISRQILSGEKTIQEISDYLPCHIHTNSLDDFRILEADSTVLNHIDRTADELLQHGPELMIEMVNPDDLRNAIDANFKYLENLETQNHVAFFQRVKFPKEKEEHCFYTRGRVLDDNRIINLSVPTHELKLFNHTVLDLFQNSSFIKRNLAVFDSLTKKEVMLCQYFCQENSLKDIADSLHLSIHTIKNHKINIYKKLNVNNFYDFYYFCTKFKIDK
ncbi:helix-turn-helix transcriptional regulator [Aquimarina agarilytica]|uniref:helix-turn-helix transcriptional regulator n=1 Tax=Aquimarina agarilytica TaxID=1087449 RepID=UPI0002880A66|nr:LuxR C-terminal-related transcriptional regulator [Aquimarina agarilytica]